MFIAGIEKKAFNYESLFCLHRLSTKYEIMSYFDFRSSFKDKGSSVYVYDIK